MGILRTPVRVRRTGCEKTSIGVELAHFEVSTFNSMAAFGAVVDRNKLSVVVVMLLAWQRQASALHAVFSRVCVLHDLTTSRTNMAGLTASRNRVETLRMAHTIRVEELSAVCIAETHALSAAVQLYTRCGCLRVFHGVDHAPDSQTCRGAT